MKNFLSLKLAEYLSIAPKIFDNASVLLNTAQDAAEKGNYGVACSLTILGTEELIKGLVVKLRGYKAKVFEIKDIISSLFKSSKKARNNTTFKGY